MSLTKRDAVNGRDWWWSQAAYHARDAREYVAACMPWRKTSAVCMRPHLAEKHRRAIVRALRAFLEACK